MKLTRKHIGYLKIISLILMIGLMVVLNKQQESAKLKAGNKTESSLVIPIDHSGIGATMAQVPTKTEGAIPLKLISNPNSNFLTLVNCTQEVYLRSRFVQFKKVFLKYCCKIHSNYLIEYLATSRNKDIQ
jgi:hypothetical protein